MGEVLYNTPPLPSRTLFDQRGWVRMHRENHPFCYLPLKGIASVYPSRTLPP